MNNKGHAFLGVVVCAALLAGGGVMQYKKHWGKIGRDASGVIYGDEAVLRTPRFFEKSAHQEGHEEISSRTIADDRFRP